ncbi:MAG: DUF1015 domain-containing protein [Ruminococcaceae bacterium]|jgi:uncharacterized protein (DUF1015 family)|nr:DUF1015 domain-containing protein [Oscillospiraceae bacterium]
MNRTVFCPADILLPHGVDMQKWSVVACDQYTSEPEYWNRVEQTVGNAPSTYHMILPEVFLGAPDVQARIGRINQSMRQYLNEGIFDCLPDSYLYLERTLMPGKVRRGLVGRIDLMAYEYGKGLASPVRPTEGTVESRLPPRIRVRENAPLETPHIMILIDDPEKSVIEPLAQERKTLRQVYDFTFMEHGGNISGWQVNGAAAQKVDAALAKLAERLSMASEAPLLFAVGDGNHSLATAKACYEQLRTTLPQAEWECHPARWALVELVNIHDDAMQFEPIHRVLFDVDPAHVLKELASFYHISKTGGRQSFEVVTGGKREQLFVENPSSQLAVGTLQKFIDEYLNRFGGEVDYIHGEEVTVQLANRERAVGFLLPAMQKSELFPTVIADGALPRKTFSMGHAWEKRYYLECRAIR